MMKYIKFFILGIFFGIVLSKSQAVSWFRIYEMFRFESFFMYGIIGSAVALGVVFMQIIKITKLKSTDHEPIILEEKPKTYTANLVGGAIFGLGWALVGACPGPIFILIGAGFMQFVIILIGALVGTYAYGMIKSQLPH